MPVNWGLAAPNIDIGQMAMAGFRQGQQIRRERETDNALAAYAKGGPNAVNALLRVDPRLGLQVQRDQRQQEAEAQRRQVTQAAVGGDEDALSQLAGIDFDTWSKLDGRVKEHVKKATDFLSNAGFEIGRLPPEQRAGAWSSYVQQAEAMGMDIPTQYETYSEDGLRAILAETGATKEFLKSMERDRLAVQPGGTIYEAPQPSSPFGPPQPQAATVPQSGGGQFLKRSDAERMRMSAPGKLKEMLDGGAKVVPDNFDQVLSEAQDAIARGAPREAVMARAQQLLGM